MNARQRPDVAPREGGLTERPQKRAVLVAQRLVREISERGLTEGDPLAPEREMLEQYDVGRGTLREALRYLELQGVLTMKPGPGGGPVVAAPDSRHLASTFALLLQFAETPFRAVIEARLGIEPVAAALAASHQDEDALVNLKDSVAAMREHLGDIDRFLAENRRFHDIVAWASENPIFGYLVNSLHWITDGTILGIDYPPKFRKIVLEAHELIVEGIVSGDPAEAERAMREHMDNTLVYFERKYRHLLDRPLRWEHFVG